GRQVLHEDLALAFAVEGHPAGEHLAKNDPQRVLVYLFAVPALRHLRGHVVDGTDVHGLPAPPAGGDEFRQPVVADLHDAVFDKEVAGLEVPVDDTVLVQVANSRADSVQPAERLLLGDALRMPGQHLIEALPGHVFHDDPGVVHRLEDVVDADEMGVLEVKALADAAQLDVEVLLHKLESHVLAAVGDRQKDLAEAAPAEAAPDRVPLDRLRTGSIGEFHGRSPRVNPAMNGLAIRHDLASTSIILRPRATIL